MSKMIRNSFIIIFICQFYFLSHVFGGEYYVAPKNSQMLNVVDEGLVAWNDAVNIATPCSAGTAMVNAVAGDIVYFRGGTYELGQSDNNQSGIGVLYPRNSGTLQNRIVFTAYSNENPILNTNIDGSIISRAWGDRGQNYTTLKGFTISSTGNNVCGSVGIGSGSEGTIIDNCIFLGSSTPGDNTDNISGLAFQSANNTLIVNCKFYDYRDQEDNHNTSAIKTYFAHNLTVTNCEFRNSTIAIYNKQDSDDNVYKNNFFYNSKQHILINVDNSGDSDNGTIQNNIMVNASYAAILLEQNNNNYTYNWTISNNTVYNSFSTARAISINDATGRYLYNNIIVADASEGEVRFVGDSTVTEMDHNLFHSPSLKIQSSGESYDLSSWQSSNELEAIINTECGNTNKPGCGSITSDPQFVTAVGVRDTVSEFALAPGSQALKAGRNDADMGANVTLIGTLVGGGTEQPNAPSDFNLVQQ